MSNEEPKHSLADDAAAWVPPWERRPAEPEAVDPVVVEPEWASAAPEPDVAEPDAVEPDAVEPGAVEFDAERFGVEDFGVEDFGVERFGVEPEAVEPEIAADLAELVAEEAQPDAVGEPVDAAEPAAVAAPAPDVVDRAPLNATELRGALEAIMLVVDEPVTEVVLAQVLEQPTEVVAMSLGELAQDYARGGRGFELRRAAGGWRLYTRGEYASYVERFVLDGQQVRITQAALETLAVVAYKQPVTRSRISAIRGVNCDGVIRTLVSRGLIEECGTEPESGAFLFRTTSLFLEKLGLDSVDELPPLAPFLPNDVDEIADAQR